MKWHSFALFTGMGLYLVGLAPGVLPHKVDTLTVIVAGVTTASMAIFGFDHFHLEVKYIILMIGVGLATFTVGVLLTIQGHIYILPLVVFPSIALSVFGAKELIRQKTR